jgi:cellulose biosynthesis protein BcsQ
MKVFSVIGITGGTSTTDTAVNFASSLAGRGHKVLLMDLSTGGVGHSLKITVNRDITVHYFVTGEEMPNLFAVQAKENLEVILSDKAATVALEIALETDKDREKLRDRLAGALYDFAVLDTEPEFEVLYENAWRASDFLIIPIFLYTALESFVSEELSKVWDDIKGFRELYGEAPEFFMVPLGYEKDRPLSQEILEKLKAKYVGRVTPGIRVDAKTEDYDVITDFILGEIEKIQG